MPAASERLPPGGQRNHTHQHRRPRYDGGAQPASPSFLAMATGTRASVDLAQRLKDEGAAAVELEAIQANNVPMLRRVRAQASVVAAL